MWWSDATGSNPPKAKEDSPSKKAQITEKKTKQQIQRRLKAALMQSYQQSGGYLPPKVRHRNTPWY